MRHSGKHDRGFTLIEIVAVLIVIGIIGTAVTISSVYSTSANNPAAQAEVIKGHLRYAQARAMNSDVVWGIHFDSNKTYKLFTYDTSLTYLLLPGESSETKNLEDMTLSPSGNVYVAFDSWGKPYTYTGAPPVTFSLAPSDINITVNNSESAIVITKNTGFIP